MDNILAEILRRRNPASGADAERKAREVLQETILYALGKTSFFEKAAFYGGSAGRIFYGLPRYSEDLDFTLLKEDAAFTWEDYFPTIQKVLTSFGLKPGPLQKEKIGAADTRSAFLKENRIETMGLLFPMGIALPSYGKEQLIKIKFEVDTNLPSDFSATYLSRMEPSYFDARVLDEPSLFAGKIGAVLTRAWKNRVKGRDLFDYLFYLSRGVKINLPFLEAQLRKAKFDFSAPLTLEVLKELLKKRFLSLNYSLAIEDVSPFLEDAAPLSHWNAEYFLATLNRLPH